MKPVKILLTSILAIGASSLFAQTGAASGTRFGMGEDSIRCLQNISLYEPYAKARNFKDAVDSWEIVYNECPKANKNIYIYGVRIVNWQIEQEKDAAKQAALKAKLMEVYDNRIKHFGDDKVYPTPRILGNKASDYLRVYGNEADNELAYEWLTQCVEYMKGATTPEVVKDYVSVAEKLFKANGEKREQYINNYLQGVEYLDQYIKNSTNPDMNTYAENIKSYLNDQYARSGAADCESLQAVFGPKVEEKKEDIAYLKQTISLLRRSKCQESDVYFAASEYAHKIEPTMESAIGMARQSIKKDDYTQALTFFTEAEELATEADDKADVQLTIAGVYYQRRNYPQARSYALKSVQNNPNQSTPYMLIASMYAADAKNIYPNDPVLAQSVFYAAVDKLERARAAEPAKAAEINSQISSYSAHFPSNQDIFMHPELAKVKTITIGVGIQEKTTVK